VVDAYVNGHVNDDEEEEADVVDVNDLDDDRLSDGVDRVVESTYPVAHSVRGPHLNVSDRYHVDAVHVTDLGVNGKRNVDSSREACVE
jgi:hypothetical protein